MGNSRKLHELSKKLLHANNRAQALHQLMNRYQWIVACMLSDMSKATGEPPIYTCKMDNPDVANGEIKLLEDGDTRTVVVEWVADTGPIIREPTAEEAAALGILKLVRHDGTPIDKP